LIKTSGSGTTAPLPSPKLRPLALRAPKAIPLSDHHAIYSHPFPNACELRLLGDENDNNLLMTELARFDYTPLEEKASALREALIEKGWTELSSDASTESHP